MEDRYREGRCRKRNSRRVMDMTCKKPNDIFLFSERNVAHGDIQHYLTAVHLLVRKKGLNGREQTMHNKITRLIALPHFSLQTNSQAVLDGE